jgi:hypothetical protein
MATVYLKPIVLFENNRSQMPENATDDYVISLKDGGIGLGSVPENTLLLGNDADSLKTLAPVDIGEVKFLRQVNEEGTITTAWAQLGASQFYFVNTARLLGRTATGGGVGQEISLGDGLAFDGTTLKCTGVALNYLKHVTAASKTHYLEMDDTGISYYNETDSVTFLRIQPDVIWAPANTCSLGTWGTPFKELYLSDKATILNPTGLKYIELDPVELSIEFKRFDNNIIYNTLGVVNYYGLEEYDSEEYEVRAAEMVVRQLSKWESSGAREDVEFAFLLYDAAENKLIDMLSVNPKGVQTYRNFVGKNGTEGITETGKTLVHDIQINGYDLEYKKATVDIESGIITKYDIDASWTTVPTV